MRDQNPATEYDLKKYYPQHFQKTLNARREGVYNYILLNLKKGIKEGLYRKEMNKEVIAKLYLWRIENSQLSELFTAEEFSSIRLFGNAEGRASIFRSDSTTESSFLMMVSNSLRDLRKSSFFPFGTVTTAKDSLGMALRRLPPSIEESRKPYF